MEACWQDVGEPERSGGGGLGDWATQQRAAGVVDKQQKGKEEINIFIGLLSSLRLR